MKRNQQTVRMTKRTKTNQDIASSMEIGDLLIATDGNPMFLFEKSFRRRFEYSDARSNKFWEIEMEKGGTTFTTTYGRIGSGGTSNTKEWHNPSIAKAEYQKIVRSKEKKGYREIHSGHTYSFNNPAGRPAIVSFHENDIVDGLTKRGWEYHPKKANESS